ncbi:hypothetical protein, partial [Paenibacillus thermotolerans]|uniref:hypothetical protein n=1 Tax=Paenibacillus thermotolerans TaxID=3027807 RepID=UPI002368EDF3
TFTLEMTPMLGVHNKEPGNRCQVLCANGRHRRYIVNLPAAISLTDTTDAKPRFLTLIAAFSRE